MGMHTSTHVPLSLQSACTLSAQTVSGHAMPAQAWTVGSVTLTANVGHSQQVAAASTQSAGTLQLPRPGPIPPLSLPTSSLGADASSLDELKHPARRDTSRAPIKLRTSDEEQSTSCA